MPIDINLLRVEKGGNPDVVRQSEIKRGRTGDIVLQIIEQDKKWREVNYTVEQQKKNLNLINKQIGDTKKVDRHQDCSNLVNEAIELNQHIVESEKLLTITSNFRDALLYKIGNIVDANTPVSSDEKNNKVLKESGYIKIPNDLNDPPIILNHFEIMTKLNIVDMKKGSELFGHRGYFLKGIGVMLNYALIQYGLAFLRRHGYEEIQPPFLMRREIMEKTSELSDFNETLYKIHMDNGQTDTKNKEDLFLIATSEQPISALHRKERLNIKNLPLKYSGISTCFRKEAGSHGKDMWGVFRVHQFEKVEQFLITSPENSQKAHDDMIAIAEQFYESLDIPFRVVSIVSGALNDAASIKYDLEAWFPSHQEYRELVSCSNCTDYQSRALDIRLVKDKDTGTNHHPHMLNGTLVATQRAMCCILENYQTRNGINIPRVLLPYMDGIEFIPYTVT